MKLVIDTNVLISALIKDSVTREILLFPSFEFFLPEYALEEVDSHKDLISKRSGLSAESANRVDKFLRMGVNDNKGQERIILAMVR